MKRFVTFWYNRITQSLNLGVKINIKVYFVLISFVFSFFDSCNVFVLHSYFHVFYLQWKEG